MWLTHSTRTLITPCSENNYCSWTSQLSSAHRAHHMQSVTYYNSSKTQQPRTTFWKTAREARTTFHSHRKHQSQRHTHQTHYLSLSNIYTSKLLTENGGTGCLLGPNSPTPSLQAPRYHQKNSWPPNHQKLQAKLSLLLL